MTSKYHLYESNYYNNNLQKIGFNNNVFTKHKINQSNEDEFIKNPFKVEEGAIECKCGSKRTLSFTKQSRSCDEPASVIVKCIECKSQWVYSG